MLMAITERFREIATMKCLGATDGFIMSQFMMEAGLQGLAGGAIGVLIGLVLAMVMPATTPWWVVITGTFIAVVIGKQIFGGIGYNIFNPALIGRAFLAATYPVFISSWAVPTAVTDAITGATPLAMMKFDGNAVGYSALFLGTINGSVGESSALLLIAGSIYLFIKKYIKWRVSASIILTVAVLGGIFHLINPDRYPDPLFHLLAGGLMIGALYMATDMVSSPVTKKGMIYFGVGIGVLVIVIRLFGGLPEGVMYAIIFMNALVPLINRGTKPRIFGTGSKDEQ
jgi:electron transport complex protein RnfD